VTSRRQGNGAKRRQTIRRIIIEERNRTGRVPTAEEIARLLAMSVVRVRFHLNELQREGRAR
jgi:predicted ArsR family transcriptional regulator